MHSTVSAMRRSDILSEVYGHHGEFFSVTFIKRTTGEKRVMRCRKGVKKYLAGGPAAYNPHEKKVIFVFDMDKMDYRCIPIEGVQQITLAGTTYEIVED